MSERRGTIAFEAQGKSYALRLGTAQLAEAEDHFDMGINAIVKRLETEQRIGDVAQMLAIGTGVSRDEACDIVDDLGTKTSGDLLGRAIRAAFGQPEPGAPAGNGKGRKRTR